MADGHMVSSSTALATVRQDASGSDGASTASPQVPGQHAPIGPNSSNVVTPPSQLQDAAAGEVQPSSSSLRPGDYSVLSPSARTSYTRVDVVVHGEVGSHLRRAQAEDSQGSKGDLQTTDDALAQDVALQQEPETGDVEPAIPHVPQVSLTFLLVSGRRRTMSFDQETTVGRVKELAWNAWPNEWQDERPPAPSYLRILYLGKILQDDDTLSKVGFPTYVPTAGQTSTAPSTIVHLSIRAYAPPGADDAPKKKGRRRRTRSEGDEHGEGEEDEETGCRCVCVIC